MFFIVYACKITAGDCGLSLIYVSWGLVDWGLVLALPIWRGTVTDIADVVMKTKIEAVNQVSEYFSK